MRKVSIFLRISTYSLVSDLCLSVREVFETKPIKASVKRSSLMGVKSFSLSGTGLRVLGFLFVVYLTAKIRKVQCASSLYQFLLF